MEEQADVSEMLEMALQRLQIVQDELGKFLASPMIYATVISSENELDPSRFQNNDLVQFLVPSIIERHGHTARIVGNGPGKPAVSKHGEVQVVNQKLEIFRVNIGMNGVAPHIKLLGKNDGTNVTVFAENEFFEVNGVFGKKFYPGQRVKVNLQSKQIIDFAPNVSLGDVSSVTKVISDNNVEVDINGNKKVVVNCSQTILEDGDNVQLDRSHSLVLRKIARDTDNKFKCQEDISVSWDDVGGCTEAKEALIDLVQTPFLNPDIYKFYNKDLPKGGLIYGPPGCGKTLLVKASYTDLASRFGKEAMLSGWIYVKGPELLNKWLGNTEESIRELFARGKAHFKKYGFPAFMFVDEADAIVGERGKHAGTDFERTAVPMFLSEMDGLESSKVIVLLATNRPDSLDPAVTRHGRCDFHIKVPRPNFDACKDILKVHLRAVPLHKTSLEEVVDVVSASIFSEERVIYRILDAARKQYTLCLKDVVNGAMLAGIVKNAAGVAMKRDLRHKTQCGVSLNDFNESVKKVYVGQLDQNHNSDLQDFFETHRINKTNIKIDKAKVSC